MTALKVGRVCVKTAGRSAGRFCVITGVKDAKTVDVTGPKQLTGIKRKACNVAHLEPTKAEVEIGAQAKDEEVVKALEKKGLVEQFKKRIR